MAAEMIRDDEVMTVEDALRNAYQVLPRLLELADVWDATANTERNAGRN